jgi:hypothetical protein
VDSNSRKNPARTHTNGESLVEYHSICLYVSPRGLTTSTMHHNGRLLQIDFNFIDHKLIIETTDAPAKTIDLRSLSVADFYQQTMDALNSLEMPVRIWTTPVEVAVGFHLKTMRNMHPMIQNMCRNSGAF